MITRDQIDGIGISVASQGVQRIMIFVVADGSIKRSGSGRMNDTKDDLYIGITKEPIFKKVMESVSDGIIKHIGHEITLPEPKGIPCKLTISFKSDQLVHNLVINYGYETGYPSDVMQIVKAIFEQTQVWYEKQKAVAQQSEKK
ncbi:MAG: hypothetical protein ACRDF4_02295 [Rhabdochlamydiaceae bacterium]